MSTTEIILSLAAIIIMVLIYFAGVQRGKLQKKEDLQRQESEKANDHKRKLGEEKLQRIRAVVDRYRDLDRSGKSSNLQGMLIAGVLGLHSSDEISAACSLIEAEGLTPGIQKIYISEIQGVDLRVFFQLLQQLNPGEICDDGCVRRIICKIREKEID